MQHCSIVHGGTVVYAFYSHLYKHTYICAHAHKHLAIGLCKTPGESTGDWRRWGAGAAPQGLRSGHVE